MGKTSELLCNKHVNTTCVKTSTVRKVQRHVDKHDSGWREDRREKREDRREKIERMDVDRNEINEIICCCSLIGSAFLSSVFFALSLLLLMTYFF